MSKKKTNKATSIQGFDAHHYKATQAYTQLVERLFDKATADIASIAHKEGIQGDKPFSFDDHPKTKARTLDIIKRLAGQMQAIIEEGAKREWLLACRKSDAFIASILDTSKLSKDELEAMQGRNLEALQTFQARKVGGMNLSQRVWRYSQQFQEQIEVGLDVGLGEGKSAQELSRDLRQNLQDPNRLFRRVRDKHGNLHLSKAAKAFHPGRGIYRSSYKNALRLTRSEINMAYRESDHLRWQQLDFVIGFEVRRSERKRYTECELCSKLVGKYPKEFKFKGWHPQCMCYVVPIMEDYNSKERSDDRKARLRAALNGTEYRKYSSKETIQDVPDAFKEWVANNVDKQANWASAPYFVKDNFIDGDLSKGLAYLATPNQVHTPTLLERSKARQAQRTPEQITDIQQRWQASRASYRNRLQAGAKAKLGGKRVPTIIGDVLITKNSIKEFINQPHAQYKEKNELARVLDKVIANAKYLGYGKGKHENQVKAHIFEITIDGKESWLIIAEMIWGDIKFHSISDSSAITDIIEKEKHSDN